MARAALRRLLGAAGVMLGISVIVFALFFATPGADPAARIAGRGASPETLVQVRHEFGLDRALPVQYAILMRRLFVTQDLASTVNRGQLVVPALLRAAPVSLSLVAGAAVFWVVGASASGWSRRRCRAGRWTGSCSASGVLGASIPVFWLGEVVNLVTQSRLHDTALFAWVPPLGYRPLTQDPAGWFKALLIPWLTLASLYAGLYGRLLRASLAEAYREDYIRTARAKGLGEGRILLRHALRNSLVPFVSLFGLDFGALVGGGALLTEVVFGLHGVGKLTYDAMRNLDLPVIMATVLYAAFFVVAANLVVDMAYAALDPRVRRA